MCEVVFVVDIGGIKMVVVFVDWVDVLLCIIVVLIFVSEGFVVVVVIVVVFVEELFDEEFVLVGVGIGIVGVVDVWMGMIVLVIDIFVDWLGILLVVMIWGVFMDCFFVDVLVVVQNDVDVYVMGEYFYGVVVGVLSIFVVVVGMGVGVGIIFDGCLVCGVYYVVGEFVYFFILGVVYFCCFCGWNGYFEVFGFGIGLYWYYFLFGGDLVLCDVCGVVVVFGMGDFFVVCVVQDFVVVVGCVFVGVVIFFDLEWIVVIGGVLCIGELWWDVLWVVFYVEVIDVLYDIFILLGFFGDDVLLWGVVVFVWR